VIGNAARQQPKTIWNRIIKYDRFGERLVLAQVLGIHFGRTRKQETEKILEGLKKREPETRGVSYNSMAKLAIKPYPDIQAVANAYRLCCMKAPEAKELSPMSMWDLHFCGSWIIPGLSIGSTKAIDQGNGNYSWRIV